MRPVRGWLAGKVPSCRSWHLHHFRTPRPFHRSQRGLHGGFTLAKPARELSVWSVVDAVDPLQRIRTCPLGLKSHGVNLCHMHRRLDDAMAMVEKAFRSSNVAELLEEPTRSKPLCEFPVKVELKG